MPDHLAHARNRVAEIAQSIVDGRVRPLLGARMLAGYVNPLKAEISLDAWKIVVAVASETDGMPIGSERQYWAPEPLREKDKSADDYERRVAADLQRVAEEFLIQFATPSIGSNRMSPELETLDQLLSGEVSLTIIRRLYPDEEAFLQGTHGLVSSGDVRLLAEDGSEVPAWQWRELFVDGTVWHQLDRLRLEITEQGATKIG